MFLVAMDRSKRCFWKQGSWWCPLHARLLAGTATRSGWSDGSGRVTSVIIEVLDYFEIKINRGIRGVRKSEGRRLTPERGRGIPAARQN
jgi:hypothetical protein